MSKVVLRLGKKVPLCDNPRDTYKLCITRYADYTKDDKLVESFDFCFKEDNIEDLHQILSAFMAFKSCEYENKELNFDSDDQRDFFIDYLDEVESMQVMSLETWIEKLENYRMCDFYIQSLGVTYYDSDGVEFFIEPIMYN